MVRKYTKIIGIIVVIIILLFIILIFVNKLIHNELEKKWIKIWELLEDDDTLQKIWIIESYISMQAVIRTDEETKNAIENHLKYHLELPYEEVKQLENEFMEIFKINYEELSQLKFIVFRKHFIGVFDKNKDIKHVFRGRYIW